MKPAPPSEPPFDDSDPDTMKSPAADVSMMTPPNASVPFPSDTMSPAAVMAPLAFSVMVPPCRLPERSIRLLVLPMARSAMLPVESISRLEGATPVAPVIRAPASKLTDPASIWTWPAPLSARRRPSCSATCEVDHRSRRERDVG